MHEAVDRLADVGEPLRFEPQAPQPGLERELALGGPEVVCDRGNRSPVQVEAPLGIAAGGQEKERPPGGSVNLVLGQQNLAARDRGEDDERRWQLVVSGLTRERPLELA